MGAIMAEPEFFAAPGYGDLHYSQAVKYGDRLEISGQGGWDDAGGFAESLAGEIAQAFRNVERVLAAAGAGWDQVFHVNSYHVGLDRDHEQILALMNERFQHYLPENGPVWTCVGVTALADPKMRVEIRVTAAVTP